MTPWTLPSHVSLFTGLYPWTHGVYGRDPSPLSAAHASLAELLGRAGYRSCSLSANPFISRKFGLTKGFELSCWGDWASHYIRFLSADVPPRFEGTNFSRNSGLTRGVRGQFGRSATELVNAVHAGYPPVWKWIHRLGTRILPTYESMHMSTAPWIEPTLDSWMTTLGPDEPAFCFVNLLDAHEPYLTPSSEWVDRKFNPSQSSLLLDGYDRESESWNPSDPRMIELENRYLLQIAALGKRLERLLSIFRNRRRSSNCMIILTGDHGQTFGRDGHIFHTGEVTDDLLRIPLLVKFPDNLSGPVFCDTWTSLVDIFPTIAEMIGMPGPGATEGVSLSRALRGNRSSPVYAMTDSDGGGKARSRTSHEARLIAAETRAVAFWGSCRVEVAEGASAPKVSSEVSSAGPQGRVTEPPPVEDLERQLRKILLEIRTRATTGSSVGKRLNSWGY